MGVYPVTVTHTASGHCLLICQGVATQTVILLRSINRSLIELTSFGPGLSRRRRDWPPFQRPVSDSYPSNNATDNVMVALLDESRGMSAGPVPATGGN